NAEGGQTTTAQITSAALLAEVTVGADEPATLSLNLAAFGAAGSIVGTNVKVAGTNTDVTSKGQTVEFGISGGNIIGYVDADNNNTLSAGDRIVFQLAPNGSDFTFTLLDQIDHPIASVNGAGAGGDSETLALDLSGAFLATDKDGDSVVLSTAV